MRIDLGKLGKSDYYKTAGKKPDGSQSRFLTTSMHVPPERTILIDDQWIKNFGEVVKAGLAAIIAPIPIGYPHHRGGVVEHAGVRRAR